MGRSPRSALVRYLLAQCAGGCLLAMAVGLGILALDLAGIGTLIAASVEPSTLVIFLAGAIVTVLPAALATAICLIATSEPERDPTPHWTLTGTRSRD
ncbi:MAG: hypothetical protein IT563_14775 [Alphaproteobacteria bacterium]|nr:hypothetical protein [Alphaproteobacteria bacterium]